MNHRNDIELFIQDSLLSDPSPALDPETPLFTSGILDSLGMLRLITFLEERFGIQVGDGEVGDENFGSVARINEFVERKLASPVPPAT